MPVTLFPETEIIAPVVPTQLIEFATSAVLTPSSSEDLDSTTNIADTVTAELRGVWVASEQPFFFTISTVENGVATVRTGFFHGLPSSTVILEFPAGLFPITGTAGVDNYRVSVTNNDNNKDALISATFYYRTVP